MSLRFFIFAVGFHCLGSTLPAQESKPLPDRIARLKINYEAALVRAITPIKQTYLLELQKLKTEYTKAGDLDAALAADGLLKELSVKAEAPLMPEAAVGPLSEMTLSEFKRWLKTVSIAESAGEKKVFQYDGTTMTSQRASNPEPRIHQGVEIGLGVISVPFSTDRCKIQIEENLKTAIVTYDDEAPIAATINPKTKN